MRWVDEEADHLAPKCVFFNATQKKRPVSSGVVGADVTHFDCVDVLLESLTLIKPDIVIVDYSDLRFEIVDFISKIESYKATKSLPVLLIGEKKPKYEKYPTHVSWAESSTKDKIALRFLVRALFRRVRPACLDDTLYHGFFELDQSSFSLSFKERRMTLNRRDLCFVSPFFDSPEHILDRELLMRLVYSIEDWEDDIRNIDSYLSKLRKQIKNKLGVELLQTVRGKGYMMQKHPYE